MKTKLLGHATQFGATPTGADWCLKALHPSDPLVEVRGIPNMESLSTVHMNYQSTYKISPQAGATGTWGFKATVLPNPVQFMEIDVLDSVAPAGVEWNCLNTQISGSTFTARSTNFLAMAERWRMTYMGVTCYQDGPDLANQGSIVACQVPVEGWEYPLATDGTGSILSSAFPVIAYQTSDQPVFEQAQAMPNSYFNRSREGCYMPLRLGSDVTRWRSAKDSYLSCEVIDVGQLGFARLPSTVGNPWPHTNAAHADPYLGADGFYANPTGTTHVGTPIPGMLSSVWGHIIAQNLDVSTSFTFYVRMGLELQVQPSSVLAPQMKLSPPYDAEALETYYRISRELKDAYPADFNDLGKMWDVVSNAAKLVLPWVAKAGPYGAAVATLGGGAVKLGDSIRARKKDSRDLPSAAQVERARNQVATSRALVVYKPPRPSAKKKKAGK